MNISLSRTSFETGKYHIFILDEFGDPVTDIRPIASFTGENNNIENKRKALVNQIQNLSNYPVSDNMSITERQALTRSLNNVGTEAINIVKDTEEIKITSGSKYAPVESSPRIMSIYIDRLLVANSVVSEIIKLNNLEGAAKNDYSDALSEVNGILLRTLTQECLVNGRISQLSRIRSFVIKFVANPLEEQLLNSVDNQSIWTITEDDLKSLSQSAQNYSSNLKVVSDSLDKECQEKGLECSPEDFQPKLGDYFSTDSLSDKTIRCRVCYRTYSDSQSKNIRDNFTKLKEYLERTNEIRRAANLAKDGTTTTGFAIVNTGLGVYSRSGNSTNTDISSKISVIKDPGNEISNINWTSDLPKSLWVNNNIFEYYAIQKDDKGKFDWKSFPVGYNPDHSEARLLTKIANEYCNKTPVKKYIDSTTYYNTYSCQKVNVEIFTDRKTCDGCGSIIQDAAKITPNITVNIHEISDVISKPVPYQSIYFSSPSSESIPTKIYDFYKGISCGQ